MHDSPGGDPRKPFSAATLLAVGDVDWVCTSAERGDHDAYRADDGLDKRGGCRRPFRGPGSGRRSTITAATTPSVVATTTSVLASHGSIVAIRPPAEC